jgi:hypothetical protein
VAERELRENLIEQLLKLQRVPAELGEAEARLFASLTPVEAYNLAMRHAAKAVQHADPYSKFPSRYVRGLVTAGSAAER